MRTGMDAGLGHDFASSTRAVRGGSETSSSGAVPTSLRSAEPDAARSRPARWISLLALLPLVLIPAAGCGSSGSQAEVAHAHAGPIELRYRAIASNATFGIVNESHTPRTELYSKRQPLDQATTKVSPDEVVDAIVEHFRDQGFFDIAQVVPASEPLPPNASQMLEVTTSGGNYRAVLRPGVAMDFVAKFQTCAKALRDVYNDTIQLQAVDAAPAWGGGTKPAAKSHDGRSGG